MTDKEPFIRADDRPELEIDLDAQLANITVRDLVDILRIGPIKTLKDAKDRKERKEAKDLKEQKDAKDRKDTKDFKDQKENKDRKDDKDQKDGKDHIDGKVQKDEKDLKDRPPEGGGGKFKDDIREDKFYEVPATDLPIDTVLADLRSDLEQLVERVSGLEQAAQGDAAPKTPRKPRSKST